MAINFHDAIMAFVYLFAYIRIENSAEILEFMVNTKYVDVITVFITIWNRAGQVAVFYCAVTDTDM